mmetsp:Transcript_28126/g.83790  ORF Transcript_28126/g.83790 Transcript_28126/m.83790 type:complete len:402 (+) Transcript_28126:21-1226(+)|eukprot:CAMPEP_0196686842 /NCGR_PEP_ID=MMETSP1090-20130531/13520_1 /TAXON_ID=37098 /ORGANISM="Isochrysis sp, Strain CCMP1244" /LENGTH=401 /DNA_ID=CAMNT_0042025551 /DNA_START=21 /DNA_END=1226 /DNA_ORIENTATION=-
MADAELLDALRELRGVASVRGIQLGPSLGPLLGGAGDVADRATFCAALARVLPLSSVPPLGIERICQTWGDGERSPDGRYQQVHWRDFAADFDALPPPGGAESPTRLFAGRYVSDIFCQAPAVAPERRIGRKQFGELTTASDVHFGGPEDIVPTASRPNGRSENITRSSFVIQGPEAISHTQLLSQVRLARERNPHAGRRNQESADAPAAAASGVAERGRRHRILDQLELTDAAAAPVPVGMYRDKDDRPRRLSLFSGLNQRSAVGDKLAWDGGSGGAEAELEARGRARVASRAAASHAGAIITGGALPQGVTYGEACGLKPLHPLARQDKLQEAMCWNPPDVLTRHERAMRRMQAPPDWAVAEHILGRSDPAAAPTPSPGACEQTTWGQMRMQGQLRGYA